MMKAVKISDNLLSRLSECSHITAKVHSVFKNACNLDINGQELITLINSEKQMVPSSIALKFDNRTDFLSLGIFQGMVLTINTKGIHFTDISITVELNNLAVWNSQPDFTFYPTNEERISENLKTAGIIISKLGKLYGIGPLISKLMQIKPELNINLDLNLSFDKNYEFVFPRFMEFIEVVTNDDLRGLSFATKRIIGFGPGLTPSMDDFICGIMIANIYYSKYCGLNMGETFKFNNEIIKDSLSCTTRISSEMLKHAAAGQVSECTRKLIVSILSVNDDKKLIEPLMEILRFGDTSGTDTALGIYVGLKILTIKFRRLKV